MNLDSADDSVSHDPHLIGANTPLTDAGKETNRRKSQVRAKAEHSFRTLKSIYGFAKVRYRGLMKNANRAFALLALINLDKSGYLPTIIDPMPLYSIPIPA